MEEVFYAYEPKQFETIRSIGLMTTIIRYDIREVETEDSETEGMIEGAAEGSARWACKEFLYHHRTPLSVEKDYPAMVTALVRSHYSADDVEAIQQNYMESKTTGHKKKFAELKEWRAQAKTLATEALKALCP